MFPSGAAALHAWSSAPTGYNRSEWRRPEASMTTPSLYERIGGEAAVMAAVDIFYAKVLAHDLLRPFFAGLDMQAQIRKQVAFMSWAFGGPVEYRGRDLTAAHANLV